MIAGALRLGRAQAVARFTEVFEVYTTDRVMQPNGLYFEEETVIHDDVPGRVKYPSLTVAEREQGAQVPAVQDLQIHVAVGATPDAVVNTRWRVKSSTADADLVGSTFRTKGAPQGGQVTAHRYPVEGVS